MYFPVEAQSRISIGEPIPELYFEHVLNTETGDLALRSFEGQVVILDFWTVTCGGCIAAFPKLQALQEKFDGRLQIILVTENSKDEVERLFSRNGMDKSIRLPMIVGDTVLTRLFEFRTVPTHAWIDSNGNLVYFTDGSGASEANIAAFLAGTDIGLPYKNEFRDFNPRERIFKEGRGRQLRHLRAYSLFYGHIDDDGARINYVIDSVSGIRHGVSIQNQSIAELYRLAWKDQFDNDVFVGFGNYGNMDWQVADFGRYWYRDGILYDWFVQNTYCYEIMTPIVQASSMFTYMREDLDRYFQLETRVEEREVDCLVLQNLGRSGQLISEAPHFHFTPDSDTSFRMVKRGFHDLLFKIDALFGKQNDRFLPLVNESGYRLDDVVDLSISGNLADFGVFRQQLQLMGLDLSLTKRRIKILVIKERP